MGDVVVVRSGGIGRTKQVIGPFEDSQKAYQYCRENDLSMKSTNIKPVHEP